VIDSFNWRADKHDYAHLLVSVLAMSQGQMSDFDGINDLGRFLDLNLVQFREKFAFFARHRRQNLDLTKFKQ
jgi:hypothetical protein